MSAEQMAANRKAYLAGIRETSRERMTAFARCGELAKKIGQPEPPPLEIADHPDLLARAWGWDRILPYHPMNPWSRYKKYLREYYRLNVPRTALSHQLQANAAVEGSLNGGDANDLTALAESCINMECQVLDLLNCHPQGFHLDEASRSNKITNCVRKLINMKCCEFPAAAIALKCIMKEANLMCELVMSGICSTAPVNVSSAIRQCALNFMTYKGDDFYTWSATLMAAMREAKVMSQVLRKERDDKKDDFSMSQFLRNRTLGAMVRICYEHTVEESTRASTAGELIHDGSADKSGLDTESVKEDNPEKNDTKDKGEPVRVDNLKDINKNQRTKEDGIKGDDLDESKNQKIEVKVPEPDNHGKRHTKHGSMLQELLKISNDEELDEDANLLSHSERKEFSGKAIENVLRSAPGNKKHLNAGCFSWVKRGRKINGTLDV